MEPRDRSPVDANKERRQHYKEHERRIRAMLWPTMTPKLKDEFDRFEAECRARAVARYRARQARLLKAENLARRWIRALNAWYELANSGRVRRCLRKRLAHQRGRLRRIKEGRLRGTLKGDFPRDARPLVTDAGEWFPCVKIAADIVSETERSLYEALRKPWAVLSGCRWKYADAPDDPSWAHPRPTKPRGRSMSVEWDGRWFPSIKAAADAAGVRKTVVGELVRLGRPLLGKPITFSDRPGPSISTWPINTATRPAPSAGGPSGPEPAS